jgi:hypothetical protein
MGIASYLLGVLEDIARENDFRSFSAAVLRENASMIQVFKKRYPNAEVTTSGESEFTIIMDFSDAVPRGRPQPPNGAGGRSQTSGPPE